MVKSLLTASRRILMLLGVCYLLHVLPSGMSQSRQQVQRQIEQVMHPVTQGNDADGAWTMSAFDLTQNMMLAAQKDRLDKMDTHLSNTDNNVGTLSNTVSEEKGEAHVWFSILGAMVLGAISLGLNNFLRLRDAGKR